MSNPSHQPFGDQTGALASPSDLQQALLQLREGLMTLKASLLELAEHHEEELGMQRARPEADAFIERLRRNA